MTAKIFPLKAQSHTKAYHSLIASIQWQSLIWDYVRSKIYTQNESVAAERTGGE